MRHNSMYLDNSSRHFFYHTTFSARAFVPFVRFVLIASDYIENRFHTVKNCIQCTRHLIAICVSAFYCGVNYRPINKLHMISAYCAIFCMEKKIINFTAGGQMEDINRYRFVYIWESTIYTNEYSYKSVG